METCDASGEGTSDANDGHGDHVEHDCAFEVINARYLYDQNEEAQNLDETGEPALNGIINMKAEVMKLREVRGTRNFQSMPLIMTGIVTGVEVKFRNGDEMKTSMNDNGTGNPDDIYDREVRGEVHEGEKTEGRRNGD